MPDVIRPAALRQGNAAVRPEHDVGRVETGFRAARVDVLYAPAMGDPLVDQVSTQYLVRYLGYHKVWCHEHELSSLAWIDRIEDPTDGKVPHPMAAARTVSSRARTKSRHRALPHPRSDIRTSGVVNSASGSLQGLQRRIRWQIPRCPLIVKVAAGHRTRLSNDAHWADVSKRGSLTA